MGTKAQILAGEEACVSNAHMNEPLFVLRGTDPRAPALVRDWARQYHAAKIADRQPPLNGSQLEMDTYMTEQARRMAKHGEAVRWADRMDAYREGYEGALRVGLSEAEAIAAAEAAASSIPE